MNDTDESTELARERSREASERTLMSWIRTSLALIGFGFGLGKVHHYMETAFPDINLDAVGSTRYFGGAFMVLGTFCLIVAGLQYWRTLKQIKQRHFKYRPPWPLTGTVAALILFIGLLAFIELLFQ